MGMSRGVARVVESGCCCERERVREAVSCGGDCSADVYVYAGGGG